MTAYRIEHELVVRQGNLVLSVVAWNPCDESGGAMRIARRVLGLLQQQSEGDTGDRPGWPERWRRVRSSTASVAALRAALSDADHDVRRSALLGLAQRGKLSEPLLKRASDDPDWEVRWAAPRLQVVDDALDDDVRGDALARALRDGDPAMASAACVEIIARQLREAVPWSALRRGLVHREANVRRCAFEVLAFTHIPETAADDGGNVARVRTRRHQPQPAELLALMGRGLGDPDPHVRAQTAGFLALCADSNSGAGDLFVSALSHADLHTRRAAAWEIDLARPGANAIPALIAIVGDERIEARAQAVSVLGDLGAEEALPALHVALASGDEELRFEDARAGQSIAGDHKPMLEIAAEHLASDEVHVRAYGVSWVNDLGPAAKEFVPRLIEVLASSDARERIRTVNAVRRIGAAAAPAVDALDRLADDEDPKVRRAAADAARSIRSKGTQHGGGAG